MISIVTWNVNSVRPRLQHLLNFLREQKPDVVLLQETKVENDKFPTMEIEELGYNIALNGQKTYNGVAILSRFVLEDVQNNLPNFADEQARYIEAVVCLKNSALRVASVYVPNGQDLASDKFQYKMEFLDKLRAHANNLLELDEILVLGGDYNVAPEAGDVFDPQGLAGNICFHPREREKLRSILYLGLYDAWRAKHPHQHAYSWWDYRGNSFAQDKGLRIDHLLLSAKALDVMHDCEIIRTERERDTPSDHAPVTVWLE